jgi:fatty acid desaturase
MAERITPPNPQHKETNMKLTLALLMLIAPMYAMGALAHFFPPNWWTIPTMCVLALCAIFGFGFVIHTISGL